MFALGVGWGGATPSFLIQAWQTSEGLPHNSPTAACQAPDGYLWIATQSGVARFDGVRFENFTTADGLPNHQVQSMLVDSTGRVWLGTSRGVVVRENGQWHSPPGAWPEGAVWSIAETKDGSLWFGTEVGLWHLKSGILRTLTEGLPADPHVRWLQAASDGSLWIVCRSGIRRWDHGRVQPVPSLSALIENRELSGIVPTPDGKWILYGDCLFLQGEGEHWEDLSQAMPNAHGIHTACRVTLDGELWVATRNQGIACRKQGVWTRIDVDSGLSHDDVRALTHDSEGNIWACTNGGGINRIKHRRVHVFGVTEGLGRYVTTSLAADAAGGLWAGTDGGGVKRFIDGRFVSAYPESDLPTRYVWSLCPTRAGGLWIGTFRDGLIHWDGERASRITVTNGLFDNWIPALLEARNGDLWIGTHRGAVQRLRGGKLETVRSPPDGKISPITCLLEDRSGVLWVATAGDGLLRFKDGRWQEIGSAQGLPSTSVTSLCEDHEGRLWLGTAGGGLGLWQENSFKVWRTDCGLARNVVLQILDDSAGNLWLGTDLGLQRVAVSELLAIAAGASQHLVRSDVYSRGEGLPTPQFSSGHGNLTARSADGSLWFSLAAGAVQVGHDASEPLVRHLPLKIESVTAGGAALWNEERTPEQGNLSLEWPTAPLEFRFTVPSFSAPEKVRFRYRMEGLDETWRESEGRRFATFSSLPPGSFRFVVSAAHAGDAWSDDSISLGIVVHPRFWQTVWFRLAVVFSGMLGAAVFARWWALRRIRTRVSVLEQERRVQEERARIAQDLHDDLGSTLTEINFLGTLGAANANSPVTRVRLEGIIERAQRMAKSLDEIVWTVNPTNDWLPATVNYLCSRTQESLTVAGLRCRLEVADYLPQLALDSELRHHLLMALNEAVNNVMKHATANEVQLVIAYVNDQLHVTVTDDGCGFDPMLVSPARNGLSNLRKRLESAGGFCQVQSTAGQGSRVMFVMPLAQPVSKSRESPRSGGFLNHSSRIIMRRCKLKWPWRKS
jgi:ligand-binding sensor domain-containing protein/signal transduction histidine kinase